jgi:hypothetical protein
MLDTLSGYCKVHMKRCLGQNVRCLATELIVQSANSFSTQRSLPYCMQFMGTVR